MTPVIREGQICDEKYIAYIGMGLGKCWRSLQFGRGNHPDVPLRSFDLRRRRVMWANRSA
jgi:hypothetical protein